MVTNVLTLHPSARCSPPDSPDAVMEVVPAMLSTLTAISTLRVTIPADLRPSDNRRTVLLQLQELCRRWATSVLEQGFV